MALALGAYQTRLMQTQARASVWPYLDIGYQYNIDDPKVGFDLRVQNNGVGPALVRSVHVTFDGKPLPHWQNLFVALFQRGKLNAGFSGLHNIVIPPSTNRETDVSAVHVTDADPAKIIYEARERLTMEICYCSIYDDCWIVHWPMARPVETPACHETANEFDY
jgi:hypothetical protein